MNDTRLNQDSGALTPLLEAAREVEDRLERALARLDLSRAKLTALTRLQGAGSPLALSELAERCSCVRSNITQLVDRLEADGLVRRVADPNDRRSVRAELTREGRDRQAKGAVLLAEVEAEVAGMLPESARAALAGLAAWRA